jgi:hypothetical protein
MKIRYQYGNKISICSVFFHFWGKGVGAVWRGKNAIGGGILFFTNEEKQKGIQCIF